MTKIADLPTHSMEVFLGTRKHLGTMVFERWGIKFGTTALHRNMKEVTIDLFYFIFFSRVS